MYDWGEKRKSIQNALKSGLYVLGTFKVDHLQPVDPILFHKFSLFFTFMLGANSYYPRESNAENGKIECDRGVSVPGAYILDHLQPVDPILFHKFSNFFTFMLGAILITPERGRQKIGK